MIPAAILVPAALFGAALAEEYIPAGRTSGGLPASDSSSGERARIRSRSLPTAPASNASLQRAEVAVEGNLLTSDGRVYADSAAALSSGPLGRAAKACRDSLAPRASADEAGKARIPPDTSSVQVYLMLSRRGSVKILLVSPPQLIEDCLARKAAAGLAFPPPPGPNHWIRVRVRPAPRPD